MGVLRHRFDKYAPGEYVREEHLKKEWLDSVGSEVADFNLGLTHAEQCKWLTSERGRVKITEAGIEAV